MDEKKVFKSMLENGESNVYQLGIVIKYMNEFILPTQEGKEEKAKYKLQIAAQEKKLVDANNWVEFLKSQ